jgi:anaerobic magnesium-protoporphyrin IX monomethyl ester cyclase
MYNHALCVYPYQSDGFHAGFLPPLGLELIASVLEPNCQSLEILDLRKRRGSTIDFCRPKTDLVCFSVNWKRDVEFIRREIRCVPAGAFILLGGRHVTENPEDWFAACPNIDAIVRGDGEETVEELCRGKPPEEIMGLSFRKNGRIVHNPNRTPGHLREDLLPARHLRTTSYQFGLEGVEAGIPVDMVSSSRGCPFNCNFCSFSRNPWGNKRPWSARSPQSVADELARIEAPIVAFADDLFTFDMDRVDRICDLILASGIRKKYIINARLEIAERPEVLRKMEKAGFLMLMLGIESTQDKTLRSMRKGFDTARIRECFKVLGQSSMILNGYFIIGNIGESVEEMLQIVPFAKELGVDTIAVSTLRSSPYSGLDELVAKSPGYHIARNGKIYSDQCSVKELRDLHHRIYREFYTPGQLLQIARKGIRNGAFRFLPMVLPRLPRLAWSVARNYREHAQRRKAMEAAVTNGWKRA